VEDLGRVKLKAADLVINYAPGGTKETTGLAAGLKVGQVVDVPVYDYIDFLVARTTPEISAKARAMVASGARAEGLPDSEQQIRLMEQSGMVVKTDLTTSTIDIVNPPAARSCRRRKSARGRTGGAQDVEARRPGDDGVQYSNRHQDHGRPLAPAAQELRDDGGTSGSRRFLLSPGN